MRFLGAVCLFIAIVFADSWWSTMLWCLIGLALALGGWAEAERRSRR